MVGGEKVVFMRILVLMRWLFPLSSLNKSASMMNLPLLPLKEGAVLNIPEKIVSPDLACVFSCVSIEGGLSWEMFALPTTKKAIVILIVLRKDFLGKKNQ